MHDDRSTTSKPSSWVDVDGSPVAQSTSLSRLPLVRASVQTLTPSWVTSKAMCGRLGSTFTVWALPMWLMSAISFGLATSVTSMISRPPRGALCAPKLEPLSWQRPPASVASMSSCASPRAMNGLGCCWKALPFGVASTSCCRPVALDVICGHAADGCAPTYDGLTSPPSVSRKRFWPAGVRARAERAGRHVRVRALREEVEVGVRVAGGDRRDQLPLRAVSAGVDLG
jgi:hypothetical protein